MMRKQGETDMRAAEAIIGDNVDPVTREQCEKLGIPYHDPLRQAVGIDLRSYDSPADVPEEKWQSLRDDILGALGLLEGPPSIPHQTINGTRVSKGTNDRKNEKRRQQRADARKVREEQERKSA